MSDALVEDGRAWSKAWCDTCQAAQTVRLDYLPKDARNRHDALDVICETCFTVIATLRESTNAEGSGNAEQ